MRKITTLMLASGLLTTPFNLLRADTDADVETEVVQVEATVETAAEEKPEAPFVPFTGKITKNKVRMRIHPTLDGTIVRELPKDQLVIVLGENQDFYAIRPPADIKTYVFRTFVLDGVVEGKHVNVRIEPDTDAVVLAQLNSGDRVIGEISPINSKWLEIAPPANVRFYICKEYVEKIGDPSMMAKIERRRNEVNQLLETSYTVSRAEMQKPFNEISLDFVNNTLDRIQNEYGDFHEQSGRAKALQHDLKETYTQKKIAHLEQKHDHSISLNDAAPLDLYVDKTETSSPAEPSVTGVPNPIEPKNNTPIKESPWIPNEVTLFNEWIQQNGSGTLSDFYNDQSVKSIAIRGIVEAYTRPVRNKPGDYLLVNSINKLPIAYLYSTKVDLSKFEEQEVTLKVTPRPNNNFAFPAYYVLSVE